MTVPSITVNLAKDDLSVFDGKDLRSSPSVRH